MQSATGQPSREKPNGEVSSKPRTIQLTARFRVRIPGPEPNLNTKSRSRKAVWWRSAATVQQRHVKIGCKDLPHRSQSDQLVVSTVEPCG
jgi:hypothetical protein